MNNLSNVEEINKEINKGINHPQYPGVYSIEKSIIRDDTWIICFNSGSQANSNETTK